jgi:diguanylate cyclase (GGDEF)-like protein
LQRILKPLHAIEKTAIDVQAKRFEQIAERPNAPELARVVVAMNQMSRRVGEMLDAETAKAAALYKHAYEDETTGLANRRGYELRLTELLQGEHPFLLGSVIAVELDDMRLLNRAHGFAAGAKVLRVIAESARSIFSPYPLTLLARSNEFSFSFVTLEFAHKQASDIATALQRQILDALGETPYMSLVAVNTGVSFFRQQDLRSAVFARADMALESARQSERNGIFTMPDNPDENSALGSYGWRTLIQTALGTKRWRLLRQPVMSLSNPQRIVQTECMARLVDAQGALVPAATFMPMAARHRLMPEVDLAMMTLALEYLMGERPDQSLVAVNLSPQSMADTDFMDWFAGSLAGLNDASALAIEVSEFGALRNVAAVTRVRDLVRRHGGKFGIDNFGLDPQALKLMRDILPDYVKLAGTLTGELDAVESVSDMLHSFVSLAHSLDIEVIAQKVERREQLDVLVAARVDAGQGYYFGAPT